MPQTPSRQLSYAFKKTKNDDALIRDKRTFSSDSSPRSALPVSACLGIVVLAAQTEDEKEDPVATDDDALVMEVTDGDGVISGAGCVSGVGFYNH